MPLIIAPLWPSPWVLIYHIITVQKKNGSMSIRDIQDISQAPLFIMCGFLFLSVLYVHAYVVARHVWAWFGGGHQEFSCLPLPLSACF